MSSTSTNSTTDTKQQKQESKAALKPCTNIFRCLHLTKADDAVCAACGRGVHDWCLVQCDRPSAICKRDYHTDCKPRVSMDMRSMICRGCYSKAEDEEETDD